jgi:hypothetical protein
MELLIREIGKLFTRYGPYFIGATRNFQKGTSFEKYSMSISKYSMSFAQNSAPLAAPVFIGVSAYSSISCH